MYHLADYFAAFIVNFIINVRVHARPYCNDYLSFTVVIRSLNEVVGSGRVQILFIKLHTHTYTHICESVNMYGNSIYIYIYTGWTISIYVKPC